LKKVRVSGKQERYTEKVFKNKLKKEKEEAEDSTEITKFI